MVSVPGAEPGTWPQQTDVQNSLSSVRLKARWAQVPSDLRGPEQLMRLSMQTQKLTEKPGAWSSCSFHRQELCGWWDVIWGWSTALFCPLTQNAGDSRHLRSMSPGLWQHTSHWVAACIPVFNGGNASAASAPHLPTGLSFDSTVGGRKANFWEGKAKQK